MDSYRRGKQVDRNKTRPRVRAPYRGILPIIWAIGGILFLLVLPFGWDAGLAVVFVMHLFFAGIIHIDIKAQRRQGLKWGLWRHLWFGAAFVFPFVALVYYLYSGRRVAAENDQRNTREQVEPNDDDGTNTDSEGDVTAGESETTAGSSH